MADTLTVRTCKGTRTDGEPCNSKVVRDDGYCPLHSPSAEVNPAELGRRGGIKSGETRREQAKTVRDRLRDKVEANADRIWDAFDNALDSEDERVRVASAQAVLAEAYGRPAQAIIGDPDRPVSFVLESMLARARELSEDEA